MNFSAAAVIIALIIGVVEMYKARQGIVSDHWGNESRTPPPVTDDGQARREIEELRERIKVLERITTDTNMLEARETQRIAKEIEQLRDR